MKRNWRIIIGVNVAALVAVIAGCLFMVRTQSVQSDVAKMRDEVGETMTMMSMGGANEAVARFLPQLIGIAAKWDRRFAEKREAFRGMDAEIDQVQAMHKLGATAERWRKELEGVSPLQRGGIWQKGMKAQVEAEQKKWPHRTHTKGVAEYVGDMGKEFWFGIKHGALWPVVMYGKISEIVKGGRAIDRLGVGERLRLILFPYPLSYFTMLRLFGLAISTTGLGYLMCWIGLKSKFGGLSYVGLVYFLYLMMTAMFIVCLEVTQ